MTVERKLEGASLGEVLGSEGEAYIDSSDCRIYVK